ncbi:hypothetical protein [Fodinicola acaciae]|uniref:hypothetical protein n=1 Tax=Fodinicola acaciae TaxID=2681555 RepID=UPI0013D43658|nr:hypothetical protein [Fodinicola acaciae]
MDVRSFELPLTYLPYFLAAGAIIALSWLLAKAFLTKRARSMAVWVEITVPEALQARQVAALWRLVAGILPAARWWRLTPGHVTFEVHAAADRLRCGLWLPPSVHPSPVMRAVVRAWPGAAASITTPPTLPGDLSVLGRRLRYRETGWDQLREDDKPSTSRTSSARSDDSHAVYDALVAASNAGAGILQIAVSRPPMRRLGVLREAAGTKPQAGLNATIAKLPLAVARWLLEAVVDLIGPSNSTQLSSQANVKRDDPYTVRLARRKLAGAPHFVVDVRAAVACKSRRKASTIAADITRGYAVLTNALLPIPWWFARKAVARRDLPGRMSILTTAAEAAVLIPLPAEPTLYAMPAAPGRQRPASTELWSPDPAAWSRSDHL